MKRIILSMLILCTVVLVSFQKNAKELKGAYGYTDRGMRMVLLFEDGYFMQAVYQEKQFVGTWGGTFDLKKDSISFNIEFHTRENKKVGTTHTVPLQMKGNTLLIDKNSMERIDDGNGPLAGNWRITGRKQNEKMGEIQRGPRKTLKLLTGSRFQWAAINTETKEFFGTGGGTYTFQNGKYSEKIEFFSRDSSRVGALLSFDGEVKGDQWIHSGLSSKGDPIYEIWSRDRR
ncbi:MAG: hypothetical protein ACXWV5_13630 [Flavitalea sp.]